MELFSGNATKPEQVKQKDRSSIDGERIISVRRIYVPHTLLLDFCSSFFSNVLPEDNQLFSSPHAEISKL